MTPVAPSPSPASAHDAAIAELRARRRARRRMLAKRSAFIATGLVLLAVVLLYWLLATIGGRDVLLAQVVARLPAGTTLAWDSAEGPASGPMTLRGVRFETPTRAGNCDGEAAAPCPVTGRLVFTARTIVVDPALRPLLGRRLRLDALDVTGAVLDLPRTDEPFEMPRWPDVLPEIAPPLALQADRIRIDGFAIRRAGAPLLDIARLRGGVDAGAGRLHLEHVVVDSDRGRFAVHGDYAPTDAYRTDLVASAVLPAPAGRTPPALGMVARGDLAAMDIALAGNAPAPLRVALVLRAPGGDPDALPTWSLRADSDALDPALLTGSAEVSTPVAFALRASGMGGRARLEGKLARGTLQATILPSRVSLQDQVLDVQPLVVQLLDGTVSLRGRADFRDRARRSVRFAANARGLRLEGGGAAGARAASGTAGTGPAAADATAVVVDGDLGIAGTLEAWAAIGKATLTRGRQAADVSFDARGDQRRATLRSFRAEMPGGVLAGRGSVAWAPTPGWDVVATLDGFDPGYFVPGWAGAIDGRIVSTGNTRGDGGLDIDLLADDLGGEIRGRTLRGRADLHVQRPATATPQAATAYRGEVDLAIGQSRVQATGRVAGAVDVAATLSPLRLDDLLPGASGTLDGTLRVGGTQAAPDIDADLTGSGLAWGDYHADRLQLRGRLPWRTGAAGTLTLEASGVQAGMAIDTLRLQGRGAVEDLAVDGSARGALGALDVTGRAGKRGTGWQGSVASLQLAPARGAAWRLQAPARVAWNGSRWSLARACLAAAGAGSLCAAADWPGRLDVTGTGLPLALATPYLPEREDGRPWLLRGAVDVTAQVRKAGASWRGTARVTSTSGGLRQSERARRDLVSYDNLVLAATFDPARVEATLASVLNGDGRIDGRIATGWDAYAPLRGEVALSTDALTWLELFSPDIVEPTGLLDGRITLGGTRAQPLLGGEARLSALATELPALAIALEQGDVRLQALPDGSARIAGTVRSVSAAGTGEGGLLRIDGTLGWRGAGTPLVLSIRGDDVLVSDTRDLRAVIDPDVTVRLAAGQPLTVTGKVGVPSARLDLERLDDGVSSSPDVVVLDPVDPRRTASSPLELDLELVIGDDVRMQGFGLDGTLGGSLRVRQRPGREMTASGTLDVGGRYEAYGQELEITRGRLVWSGNAIADPVLDIRAEREVGEVTAGIDVDGRASSPQATVWTDPASDESEALAYLALGRPLSSASSDESRQLDAASAALSAGGSLLASQLGTAIGLDDAGLMDSRALGGSVFGVGKFLSPRLYVGYGVSLLGTGQVLTLKYLLRKGFDVEIESSTLENRGSVNWRKEK